MVGGSKYELDELNKSAPTELYVAEGTERIKNKKKNETKRTK